MLNFSQESLHKDMANQSQAYRFLFNSVGIQKNGNCQSSEFKEYNKLIQKNSCNDFADISFNNFHDTGASELGRRLSTGEDDLSAYNFSFQEDEENIKSDFHQDNKLEMVLEKRDYLPENLDNQLMQVPDQINKDDLNVRSDFQEKDSGACIMLENDEQQNFFQKECCYENLFNNLPDESSEFESLKQSFETFAVPEISSLPEQKIDECNWLSLDKTDDKESVQAKESVVVGKSKKRSKRKTKTNSFALGRTCFRGMSNYFKDKFETALKKWDKDISNPERPSMEEIISDFIISEFIGCDLEVNSDEFLDAMVTILHSQNYKKCDSFIKKRDFKRIRALLYCYSSNAKKQFVSDKSYAIIFQHFYNNARNDFIRVKAKEKYPEFKDELLQELEDIYFLSLKTLSDRE